MTMTERIFAIDLGTELDLQMTEAGLEVTADNGDQDTTVVLDLSHIRLLRLALVRAEKQLGGNSS
jgi:hypothetical protein